MGGKKWTKEEISLLKEKYPKWGSFIPQLDRTKQAIQCKARRLGLSTSHCIVNRPKLKESEELTYIYAVILGDGSLFHNGSHYTISLSVCDKPFADSFAKALEEINLSPLRGIRKKKEKWNKRYFVTVSSKGFYYWYKELEEDQARTLVQTYPRSFLRGIYESEGYRGSYNLRITNTKDWVLYLTELALKQLGFQYTISTRKKGGKARDLYILGGMDERNRFLEEVQPCIRNKQWEGKDKAHWTEEELSILKEKYPEQGIDIPELDRTKVAIRHKAQRLNLSTS